MEFGFYLKKFVSFFVEPFGLVVLFLLLGIVMLYRKRALAAKVFLVLSLNILLLFSYPPFVNLLLEPLENSYVRLTKEHLPSDVTIDHIHVLGNGHTTDIDQPISSQLSDASTKRVLEGVLLQKEFTNAKLIFTGYKGKTSKANAMMNARLAQALGVLSEKMIINSEPKDTKEEALFTKSVVGERPFLLVTSATHMPRAMALFESLGMHPIAAPTDFHKEEFVGFFVAPDSYHFDLATLAMHEYVGLLWSYVRA